MYSTIQLNFASTFQEYIAAEPYETSPRMHAGETNEAAGPLRNRSGVPVMLPPSDHAGGNDAYVHHRDVRSDRSLCKAEGATAAYVSRVA
jgi:hypothetical protein